MTTSSLSFLYQTRTILQYPRRATTLRSVRQKQTSRNCLYAAVAGPPQDPSESFLSRKAREAAGNGRPKNKASITRTEKQVFDGIFKEIKRSGGPIAAPKHNTDATDPSTILRLFIQESGVRPRQHADVLNKHVSAEDDQTPRRPNTSFHELIKRYPSALRHKALQVTAQEPGLAEGPGLLPYQSFQPSGPDGPHTPATGGKPKDPRHGIYRPLEAPLEPATETQSHGGPQVRNFDAIKEDELARGTFRGKTADYVENELKHKAGNLHECVSASNQSLSGAFKIWEICQSQVFPIIRLLDEPSKADAEAEEDTAAASNLSSDSRVNRRTKTSKKLQKPKRASTQLSSPSSSLSTLIAPSLPDSVSPILTTATLYPALTLLALRLLVSSFPTSPFSLTLYTTIKSLSPHSRILGLNLHFYNTLLKHVWTVYSDLHGITALLSEMQSSGVDFDASTYAAVRAIEEERWTQFNTGEGSRGKEWWIRPEQTRRFQSIMEWKQTIAVRLQEQGMGHLLTEREYSNDLQAMGQGAIAETPGVWL